MNSLTTKRAKMCVRCLMDDSSVHTKLDELGICNFCKSFEQHSGAVLNTDDQTRDLSRKRFVEEVKKSAKGKKYDCVMGLSGGVDSSYAIHLALQEGLRPLVVHMDNNWNSELATNNIKNIVNSLGVDLFTYVINWGEYKKLMQAFFDADVIDVELLYDNAMLAVNYMQARKHGLKYILAGSNTATEGMPMPEDWNWLKWDKKNIKAIGKRSGVRVKSFPCIGSFDYLVNRFVKKIKWVPYLDYYSYNKEQATQLLEENYQYKRYPYKHYESVFTRFYQGYILPEKFGVDKRRLHLSSLVMSGQMSREEALEALDESPYQSKEQLEADIRFFLKKMGWQDSDLKNYLSRPGECHSKFSSEKAFWDWLLKVSRSLKEIRA